MFQRKKLEEIGNIVFGGIIGYIISVIPGWFGSEPLTWWMVVLLVLFGVLVIVPTGIFIISLFKFRQVKTVINPYSIESEQDQKNNSRKGLIVFLSLYSPQGENKLNFIRNREEKNAEIIRLVREGNFFELDFNHSNLNNSIFGIRVHSSKLEHCWIITTLSKDPQFPEKGSNFYVNAFVDYLKSLPELSGVAFHTDGGYSIPMNNDALITQKVKNLVDVIYSEAKNKYGITESEMIGDLTGGFRSLPFGMILSSLNTDRDLQYVTGEFNENNYPKSDKLYPLLFDVQVKETDED